LFIEKRCFFGENIPSSDFYGTPGHPIFIKDEEKKLSELDESIHLELEKEEQIYSFLTEKREYVKINNLDVCTWEPIELNEYVEKNNFYYDEQ